MKYFNERQKPLALVYVYESIMDKITEIDLRMIYI